MKSLSHTTKVTVRRALAALRRADTILEEAPPMGNALMYEELVLNPHRNLSQHVSTKAGFRSRAELEAFARKHRLL